MLKEAQYCQKIIATKFKKLLKMTDKDEQNFQDANEYHIFNHKWKPPLFKVLSPSFIFMWTAATNNTFEICKNASYCCARKYETWRQYPE